MKLPYAFSVHSMSLLLRSVLNFQDAINRLIPAGRVIARGHLPAGKILAVK